MVDAMTDPVTGRPNPRPRRWAHDHPRLVDAILAVVIGTLSVGSLWNSQNDGTNGHPTAGLVVLAVLASLPVAGRRVWPFPTLVVLVAAQVVLEVKNADGPGWVAALLAAYTFTTGNPRVTINRILEVGGPALALIVALSIGFGGSPFKVLPGMAFLALVMVVGDRIRRGREMAREISAQAMEQNRLDGERQLQDERSRIARELHDVVAHSMSVMIIQAGAARRQLSTNPSRASAALVDIETTGRVAMYEMRRVLGVLRGDQSGAELAPQPSLATLVDLVASCADLPVRLEQPDVAALADLPPALGVSAYRVVQEALTNVRRHAGMVTIVDVIVRRDAQVLMIEVLDDGRGASAMNGQPGFGLVGMRERVGMFAGQLVAGPRVGGGWRVRATFPMPCS
jgi:signal transduction histidine kinase